MSFPRYERYKESGVEWLGEVPEHWGISRIGFECWVRARLGWKGLKAEEYVEDGFVFLATPNIKGRDIDFEKVNFINRHRFDESPEIKLREGDVLLAKDGSTLGTVNVVRFLPRPATVNSSIAVISPTERLCGVFLYYLFQSSYMVNTIHRIKGGMGVPHLFQEDLNKFYMPLPRRDEQRAIATFLDREIAKIDALIAEQQRLIALLAAKRQAVISHAVTKGLNPDAPMKKSGVEWLGDVPASWDVVPIKYLVRLQSGGTPSKERLEYWDGAVPWASAKDIKVEYLEDTEDHITQLAVEDGAASLVDPGAVLVVVRGMILARTFPVTLTRKRMAINQDLKSLIAGKRLVPEFLAWYLRGTSCESLGRLDEAAHGTKALRMNAWTSLEVALPALSEQRDIAAFLDRETATIDALRTDAHDAIALLQERRTALISAAVTGKIDVRSEGVKHEPKNVLYPRSNQVA